MDEAYFEAQKKYLLHQISKHGYSKEYALSLKFDSLSEQQGLQYGSMSVDEMWEYSGRIDAIWLEIRGVVDAANKEEQ